MIEFILTEVKGCGWLCKIYDEDEMEIYRGEFQQRAGIALEKAQEWLEGRNG